jgi:hypothetical protein
MLSHSRIRAALMGHPKRVSGALGILALFSLLGPVCYYLPPAAERRRAAQDDFDNARDAYDVSLTHYNIVTANITESHQRVNDLSCTMQGYPGFNKNIVAFQASINNSQATSATDLLNQLWRINFALDQSTTTTSAVTKSYVTTEWQYDYYYGCGVFSCGYTEDCEEEEEGNTEEEVCTQVPISCCYGSGYHWVDVTHYYQEITIINKLYRNIINATPFSVDLSCGYYSRNFQMQAPVSVITRQTDPIYSGAETSGEVDIHYEQDYGSTLTASYLLDGTTSPTTISVLNTASQANAASDLAARLYNFLGVAIATFLQVGAGYPELQQQISDYIPVLEGEATLLNSTLLNQLAVMDSKQSVLDSADTWYTHELTQWLPTFFCVPLGVALLTYVAIMCGRDRCQKEPERERDKPGIRAQGSLSAAASLFSMPRMPSNHQVPGGAVIVEIREEIEGAPNESDQQIEGVADNNNYRV